MKSIPTVDNSGCYQTCGAVQSLAANDIKYDPNIYLRPSPNTNNTYMSPTGYLYKRPGSP